MSLDRLLEDELCGLLSDVAPSLQVEPYARAGGDSDAILPRLVVRCESQASPDFTPPTDGVYGVFPVRATLEAQVEATSETSEADLDTMTTAARTVILATLDDPSLLASADVQIFGSFATGNSEQWERENRLTRTREIIIYGRELAYAA